MSQIVQSARNLPEVRDSDKPSIMDNLENSTINFHFVRHGERQAFYPQGDGVCWSPENILNKDHLNDDGLTGLGKRMARNAGERISGLLDDKENGILLIFSSPFIRCVETAIEIRDAITDTVKNIKVHNINIDKGLCEYLKYEWFGSTLENMKSSRLEDLYLDAVALEKEIKKTASKNVNLKEHSILPPSYKLQYESDDKQDRFKIMASRILENAQQCYGLDTGPDKVVDVVFISHGGVLKFILNNMFKISNTKKVLQDLGHISYAHHCHLRYRYHLSELRLMSPFSTPTEITPGQNWNDGFVGEWGRIFKRITRKEGTDINILEIGSWEGLSATRFLSMIPNSKLWCVDHFDELKCEKGKERLEKFLYNVRATGKRQNVKLLIGFSFPALSTLLQTGIQFDFSYIDGSHRSDDTCLDAEMVWRMSKKDSLMLFDDYQWPIKSSDFPNNPASIHDIEHPKRGIDSFLEIHKNELDIVYNGYQICVKKSMEPRIGFPTGGKVTYIPLMSLLTKENMMEENEKQLLDYIFQHVKMQSNDRSTIMIFDFSK